MAPTLLVMDATVKIAGPSGNQAMPEIFHGAQQSALREEVANEIHIPFPQPIQDRSI
jgi:CO/xanthine dehydrogenase FAD-binding subunit